MLRVTIGVGIELEKDGSKILQFEKHHALSHVREYASAEFGGVTIVDSIGAWKDNTGKIVSERGWVITILTEDNQMRRDKAHVLALEVKRLLNQESVILTFEALDVEFI